VDVKEEGDWDGYAEGKKGGWASRRRWSYDEWQYSSEPEKRWVEKSKASAGGEEEAEKPKTASWADKVKGGQMKWQAKVKPAETEQTQEEASAEPPESAERGEEEAKASTWADKVRSKPS